MAKKKYSSIKDYEVGPKPRIFYRVARFFIKLFYKVPKIIYEEEIDYSKPIVIVANHAQMHGPLMFHLGLKKEARIWCTHEVLFYKTAPKYVYEDLLGGLNKPKSIRWIYKILGYLLTPVSISIFRGAKVIPVYRDARLVTTYNKSAETIKEGKSIVILPECPDVYDEYINKFNPGFVDIARFMKLKTKQEIAFYPAYVAPSLKTIIVGKKIEYDYNKKVNDQREGLLNELQEEVSRLAKSLPEHKPVHFINRS